MKEALRLAGLVLAGLAALAAAACEDSAAAAREQVQKALVRASEDIRAAGSPAAAATEDELESFRDKMERFAREAAGTEGGAPEQASVGALTSAQARIHAAEATIDRARQLQSVHRVARRAVDAMIDTAIRLDMLAESLETIDTSEDRRRLEAERSNLEEELAGLHRRVEELERPIADLIAQNERARAELDRLRKEAADLRQHAADEGPAEGLGTYENAVALDRTADGLELEIGKREAILEHELAPQLALAAGATVQLQSRIQSIDGAAAALQELQKRSGTESRSIREEIAHLALEISGQLSELHEQAGGTLNDLYEQAAADLGRAASAAKPAGSGRSDLAQTARLVSARIDMTLGAMWQGAASAMTDHLALLRRMESGPAELAEVVPTDSAATTARRDEALRRAGEAYRGARSQLDQVNLRSTSGELEALKRGLDDSLAAITGAAPAPSAPSADGSAPPRGVASPGTGAESPEALAAAVSDLLRSPSITALRTLLDHVYIDAGDAKQREAITFLRGALDAAADLDSALLEAFDAGLIDMMAASAPAAPQDARAGPGAVPGLPGGIPAPMAFGPAAMPESARLGEVSGDRGTIILEGGGEENQPLEIAEVQGRWYIDASSPPGDAAGSFLDPEQAAAMFRMFKPVVDQGLNLVRGFATRVREGEFETPEDFQQAFGSELRSLMEQVMGGVMGDMMDQMEQAPESPDRGAPATPPRRPRPGRDGGG
jgi:hypothetical protein